jgi:exopolyphosphatase/guanosine-5'-triphosphate,3'-diphosphate pyrophosphatase
VRIIANIARYHRKSWPTTRHRAFSQLKKKDKVLVKKLSAFLRIGDALDRDHRQDVVSVSAKIRPSTLLLQRAGRNVLPPDRRAFKRKADLFENLFKLKIVLSRGAMR